MALSQNRNLDRYVDQELRMLPLCAESCVFQGSLLGIEAASGCVRALEAGDAFAGIAYEAADNATLTDGAFSVRAHTVGDFEHPVSAADLANNGKAVYASDDDALTFTPTDNSYVGRQVGVVGSDKIVLRIRSVFSS